MQAIHTRLNDVVVVLRYKVNLAPHNEAIHPGRLAAIKSRNDLMDLDADIFVLSGVWQRRKLRLGSNGSEQPLCPYKPSPSLYVHTGPPFPVAASPALFVTSATKQPSSLQFGFSGVAETPLQAPPQPTAKPKPSPPSLLSDLASTNLQPPATVRPPDTAVQPPDTTTLARYHTPPTAMPRQIQLQSATEYLPVPTHDENGSPCPRSHTTHQMTLGHSDIPDHSSTAPGC